jgi:preprotein translocase subunit SecG
VNVRKGLAQVRQERFSQTMIYLITAIHVIVCLFIIMVVLLQSGKGQDIAAAFGGQGSQTAFGPRGAATLFEKATTWSAVIFMLTSITLSIAASRHAASSGSVLSGEKPAATQKAPTQTPAPAAPVSPAQK